MSIDAGWPVAMPPVAGFLEMFAGVPYNREKKQKFTSMFAVEQPHNHQWPPTNTNAAELSSRLPFHYTIPK